MKREDEKKVEIELRRWRELLRRYGRGAAPPVKDEERRIMRIRILLAQVEHQFQYFRRCVDNRRMEARAGMDHTWERIRSVYDSLPGAGRREPRAE